MVRQEVRDKSDKKRGMISKTYKLQSELVKRFKETCDLNGESQSKVISDFMQKYIDNNT